MNRPQTASVHQPRNTASPASPTKFTVQRAFKADYMGTHTKSLRSDLDMAEQHVAMIHHRRRLNEDWLAAHCPPSFDRETRRKILHWVVFEADRLHRSHRSLSLEMKTAEAKSKINPQVQGIDPKALKEGGLQPSTLQELRHDIDVLMRPEATLSPEADTEDAGEKFLLVLNALLRLPLWYPERKRV